ncbi:hypothetical protein Hanom_Chr02g00156921 [Helianthus anomalus]
MQWLPKTFMERYFDTDTLDYDFSIRIRFGDNHIWIVRINSLWESNYYIVDFLEIVFDLF